MISPPVIGLIEPYYYFTDVYFFPFHLSHLFLSIHLVSILAYLTYIYNIFPIPSCLFFSSTLALYRPSSLFIFYPLLRPYFFILSTIFFFFHFLISNLYIPFPYIPCPLAIWSIFPSTIIFTIFCFLMSSFLSQHLSFLPSTFISQSLSLISVR